MAISSAAAASGAPEAGLDVEEDDDRDEGIFADAHSGPDDDGMALAGADTQSTCHDAKGATGQGNMVRPLLVPAKNYPPAGSAAVPINIDQFDRSSPADVNDPLSSWYLDLKQVYSSTPSHSQSNLPDSALGPIAHAQLHFAI